jgi:uncharacterized protein (TIRG00374 family)
VSRDDDGLKSSAQRRQRRGWRGWLPLLVKPLRRGVVLFIVALVVEYLVVPELTGARKDLYLLNRVNGYWMAAGVVLEALSLLCYGLLTRALLRPEGRPSLFTLFRIDLAAAAVAHVIPAGTLGSAGIGYKLFTSEGIPGVEAGVMMAAKGFGSTIVLNVLLWLSLVVSIPLAGFHPIYVTVAILGAIVLLALGLIILGVTRGTDRATRIMEAIGRRLPRGWGDRFGQAVQESSANFQALGRDRRMLADALLWASLNWILDAASLWCFVAAFGRLVNPVELFAAYGIANVAGALPITPAGLGVVDSVTPLLLVSFGVTRNVATLGVLGWRLVNFWMPIPAGALAYVSLKVPRGAGLRAMRYAVSGMMSRGDPANGPSGHPDGTAPDKNAPTGKPTAQDPALPAGSGTEAAETAESMPASDGSDPAGGPARGDFRVG